MPLGDGRGRVVAGPGSGCGAAGSGMASSLGTRGPPQHPRRPLGQRPAGTLRRRMGGRAAASRRPVVRRQLPAAAVQGAEIAQHLRRVQPSLPQLLLDESEVLADETELEHEWTNLADEQGSSFQLAVSKSLAGRGWATQEEETHQIPLNDDFVSC